MTIIVFYSNPKGAGERLLSEIQARIHGHRIEVDQTVKDLSDRFRRPMIDRAVIVFVAESREQLERFVAMGDLVSNVPILLVLPDRRKATISTGHKLYPRFVTYVDSYFSDIVSVLDKLIHHVHENPFPQSDILFRFPAARNDKMEACPGYGIERGPLKC